MVFEQNDYFDFDVKEILMTPTEIHAAIMHENIQTIEEEQKLLCERQLAKAMWVLSQKLEIAHDQIIADMGQEPLWSLKDLAIYCRDQIKAKGLKKPSNIPM
tara:strand:- start:25 stop:330 length:306 start_codon:yes stop_codon:yes gene_type:complete